MPRRKSNDLDLVKGVLVFLLLLVAAIYIYRQQILNAIGWLAIILPIPLLLLSIVLFFFGKKLVRPSYQPTPSSPPSSPEPAPHVHVTHYPPTHSKNPSPESSFAQPPANQFRPAETQKPNSTFSTPSSEFESSLATTFTPELLRALEWRSFEKLTEALFRTMNLRADRLRAGADGGVDLVLRNADTGTIEGLVQCKAWNTYSVGVKPVRELFGVMHAEGAPQAYFVCTGQYTREATEWAQGKPLTLVSGSELLDWLNSLPEHTIHSFLTDILSSDYTTPTCPSCDKKLVRRTSKHGDFWGCASYPRCRYTMKIAAQ